MKSGLVLLAAALVIDANAQVVFQLPTALPEPGTHSEQGWVWNGTTVDLVTNGTGVTWDLSGALTPLGTRSMIDSEPADTPGAADFPNATHAHRLVEPPYTAWYYYRLDANDSLWKEGSRADNGDLTQCDPPYLYMHFPYAIGDLDECSTICMSNGTPTPVYYDTGYEPVATGTIVHPDGEITDAVLTRLHFNGSATGVHYWFRAGNVLEWIGRFESLGTLRLWTEMPTAIGETTNTGLLHAHPMPATDVVYVDLPSNNHAVPYSLLDATGRVLHNDQSIKHDGRLALNVSELSSGHYILRIGEAQTSQLVRISVVH